MARGITIQILGDGEPARKALEMVREQLAQTASEGKRDAGELATAMDSVKSALSGIGIAVGITAAVAAIRELVGQSLELGETMQRTSQKTGLAVQTLSTLHYAAAVTGNDFDGLVAAVGKMDKVIGQAAAGNTAAQKTVRGLGLDYKDLASRSDGAEVALKQLAQRVANAPNQFERARIATEAFGRSGAQQISLLVDLGEHWDEYVDKAKQAGVYMDADQARQLAQMNERMHALQQSVQGAGMAFTTGLIPGVANLLDVIRGGRGDMDNMISFGNVLGRIFNAGAAAVYSVAAGLAKVMQLAATANFDKQGASFFGGMYDDLNKKFEASRDFAVDGFKHGWSESRSEHDAAGKYGSGTTGRDGGAAAAKTTNPIREQAAALAAENARAEADAQKAADQVALAALDAQHKQLLVSDKDYYAQKLALQNQELDAQQAALEGKQQALYALYAKQRTDKTLHRDKNGQSAEELKTATQLLEVEDQITQVTAKRSELKSATAADVAIANREQDLAALRAAADLEKERGQGIAAQIALIQKEHELEAQKLDSNGQSAAAADVRATGQLLSQKMQLADIERQITEAEQDNKIAVEQLVDAAKKDPRLKAQNAQQINALNKQEAENVAKLVQEYTALANVLGGPAVQKAKELQAELDKLNRPNDQQSAEFTKTMISGFDEMAESMASAAAKGKQSFSEFARSAMADIARLITKLALLKLQGLFPGMGGAGVGGASAGDGGGSDFFDMPAFASGGDNIADKPSLIGEKGPEIWMPPTRGGSILPNSMAKQLANSGNAAGKAPNMTFNLVNNSSQPVTAAPPQVSYDSQMREFVTHIILEDHASGGPISQVSGGASPGS